TCPHSSSSFPHPSSSRPRPRSARPCCVPKLSSPLVRSPRPRPRPHRRVGSAPESMSMTPAPAPSDDDGGPAADPADDGLGLGVVVENLAALALLGNDDGGNDDGGGEDVGDAALSLSSGTSATSEASTLSDGAPRPRSRPRSASFHFSNRLSESPGGRPSSTPRSRPRSNPRTRTPMRRESPLLVTGARSVEAVAGSRGGDDAPPAADGVGGGAVGEALRRRSRAMSIPEENEVRDVVRPTTGSGGEAARPAPAPRAAGHWLARAAAGAHASSRSDRAAHATNPGRSRPGRSEKQRPARRKLRRWDNDRFVGTASEQLHSMLESEGGQGVEYYWREFYMPHYPLEYRSEFAKLSREDGKRGVKERFVKGEVARREETKDDSSWMERAVASKLQKLGISSRKGPVVRDDGPESHRTTADARPELGSKLYRALGPRMRSVLSRSCSPADAGLAEEPFARRAVNAFESYLVSLALTSSNGDVLAPSEGYPPKQPRSTYDLFDEVLAAPPRVVVRSRGRVSDRGSDCGADPSRAALVPTVHFRFPAEDRTDRGGRVRSSAFHRILLHAVCRFHGLESSSSADVRRGAPRREREARRGEGQGGSRGEGGGGGKTVTVQGGVLLAPTLKLLDCVAEESRECG
ncbi:hypothetical protein ACHAWF_006270, partial [Thalassiosira exigua]